MFETLWGWCASIFAFLGSLFTPNLYFEACNLSIKLDRKKVLGEGGYSQVLRGTAVNASNSSSERQFAVKKILLQSSEIEEGAMNEVASLKKFTHPNIVPFLGHTVVKEGQNRLMYLLFPLMKKGTLRHRLNSILDGKAAPFSLLKLLESYHNISSAFQVLHSYNPSYIHRDIKPENVLLGDDDVPLLTDFGSVRTADVKINSRSDALEMVDEAAQFCTLPYRPPELFDCPLGITLDARTDVWSIGCLFFAWRFGYSPFECDFHRATGCVFVAECTHLRVLGRIPQPPKTNADDRVVLELVTWMLKQPITDRPHTADVLLRLDRLQADARRKSVAAAAASSDFQARLDESV